MGRPFASIGQSVRRRNNGNSVDRLSMIRHTSEMAKPAGALWRGTHSESAPVLVTRQSRICPDAQELANDTFCM